MASKIILGSDDGLDLAPDHFNLYLCVSSVLVHELTEKCWDKCMDRPSTRLESRTEGCITNCVQRFIDSTNFVANRLQKVASQH
ncbi:hypothetical protein O3P69_008878 [Scylla paramamosain]|uniref:Mitochondrial import inner membrane translocase subunit n=1 Tax=Scylla paramamosain TaxID=85552 RepID=A0AAW0TPT8_SCYPA